MKNILFILFILFQFTNCKSHESSVKNTEFKKVKPIDRPKLVVGIVVDQMRYDYLIRFYNKYGNDGFKRLMNDGFNCENTHINYIPSHTAVGHTSIYTGTTPSMHGIISNDWYDKKEKDFIYCVDDGNYQAVGTENTKGKSPYRMQTTTLTDQLKLAQINKGKVIGISLKDRASIFPAGHAADAAYWFKGKKEAKFITSNYYMNELPLWVKKFNDSGKAKSHLKTWNTLFNINSYSESIVDDNDFEYTYKGEKSPVFPHNLLELMNENGHYDLLKSTPFGNTLLIDFAKEAILGEELGKTDATDFLAISFSSTDYVGHQFGIDSKEIEDTYIRLDKDLAHLLKFLDEHVAGEYSLFLTADHAAVPVPSYLKSKKIKAGYFDKKGLKALVKQILKEKYGTSDILAHFSNYQLFLDDEKLKFLKLDNNNVATVLADEILSFDNVYKTVTAKTLQTTNFTNGVLHYLQNGYNQKISGDVLIVPNPATIYSYVNGKGTTHGSGYSYDTHVPLLFFGKGFKKGTSKRYIPIIDIAPTMSNLLKIENPNGNTGKIITEVLE